MAWGRGWGSSWGRGNGSSTRATGANGSNRNTSNNNRSTGLPWFPSAWRAPTGPQDNVYTQALERIGAAAAANAAPDLPAPSSSNNGGGGGGRGGGGGGGGGGQPAITQAMIDAMAQALGARVPQLQYHDLPAFHGQAMGAFNAAPYRQQQQQVNQALATDQANFNTNQQATTQAVQGAYSNPYATAQVQSGPAMPVVGGALMGTVGGGADPAAANQVNAENAQNQGTFQDLLSVLAANQQSSQGSRMQQVAMDANYGRQTANAQATGMRAGIANQQAQAQNTWQQQAAERNYQNSLMQQQWQRENAQGRQATNQANWQQANTTMQGRLQPILDLIAQSRGASGLNFAPLVAILQKLGIQA